MDLPPQLEELIKAKVRSGLYSSPQEVMREALYALDENEQIRAMRLKRLKAEIQKGIDSGPGKEVDIEAKIARLEKVHKETQNKE
jgi:antitoxin ParD1/3/4